MAIAGCHIVAGLPVAIAGCHLVALHVAATSNHIDVVRRLLSKVRM